MMSFPYSEIIVSSPSLAVIMSSLLLPKIVSSLSVIAKVAKSASSSYESTTPSLK